MSIKQCPGKDVVHRTVAVLGLWLGLFAASSPAPAADAPPPRPWTELTAQRQRLVEQYQSLAAAAKTDEAMAAAGALVEVERQLIASTAADAAQKEIQQTCRKQVRDALGWLVTQHCNRRQWSAAGKRQEQLAGFCEANFGKADPRSIDARIEQAYLSRLAALKPEEAGQLATVDKSNAKIGELYRRGKFAEAIPLAQEAVQVRQRWLGVASPYYAAGLNSLASLYEAQGDYARAEPLLQQALDIWKKTLGENHPAYSTCLNNLAVLCYFQGDYARAEPLYRQAIELRKKVLGENDPAYAASLNDLAKLYEDQGDYAQAEPLVRQTLEIWKKAPGQDHPTYATGLNNLAVLYEAQGDFARAEPLYRRSLEILKKLGEDHPHYATGLNNLAGLYRAQGDYARAEPLYRQALEISEKVLGKNHPNYAASLSNLAGLYRAQDDFARAEPLFRQAVEICEKALGKNHPNYAASLNNLAFLYEAQGDYARAEPRYVEAMEIRKKTLGENHPAYAASLDHLAGLYHAQGDDARAEPRQRQAVSIQRRRLEATSVVQSERQQLAMLQSVRSFLDNYLAMTSGQDRFSASAYQQMLAWKGMVFRRQRLARAGQQTPELTALFGKLQQVARQLAKQAWVTPDPQQETHWREEVVRLSEEKERLEAELSARSAAYRQARREITLEDLQHALPKEVVLVDILQYRHGTPADKRTAAKKTSPQRLAAFIIHHEGPVTRIDLGPEQPVKTAIDTWRATFGMSPSAAAAGRQLRQTVWEPVEAKLAGAKIVLVSPDGALARLPLGALPGKEPGSYLLEERTLAIVPVAQMIPQIVEEEGHKELTKNLLLLGNIDYDTPSRQASPAPARVKKNFPRALPEGLSHFDRLSSTRGELASIEKLYRQDFGDEGILTLEEGRATKTAFLTEAAQHRYIHLATHGFFVEEKLPSSPAQRASERFGEMLRGPEATGGHVGLLCGLALAGANQAGRATGDADDGILTAEEIGSQNLDGVRMVMLSACETGLGKLAGGEGLLGLQRSFQAAGARTVVASLWKVPDEATRDLMEHFYENHWQKNMGVLPALRAAQLAMLRESRKRGVVRDDEPSPAADPKRTPPYYWAAFVLSGDWR
jgi:CHAT domain-containing protein/Flp pilus assembly protein TadD